MSYFKVPAIRYEGPASRNPFAFKYYNKDEVVMGRTMEQQCRFAMSYWHTFTYMGNDPFGGATMFRPWDQTGDGMETAIGRVHAAFEFMEKMQIPFFCFHDADIAPRADTLKETNERLDVIVKVIKEEMARTGIKCLWGTTNAFGDDKFVHGAGTSCNATVFAYAAAQIKKAMDITKELGGENYVFWGGREGYETLLNTDIALELDNLARLLSMAVDYAKEIGFTGQFLIEPKPKEPTKHQYDFDTAAVLAFLRKYDLQDSLEVAGKLGIHVKKTRICGGGAKSGLWKTMIANIMNLEVEVLEAEEGPALGGAMLAAVACGEFKSVREAADRIVRVKEAVRPKEELAERYERRYRVFREIYPALKQVYALTV